MKFIYYLLCLFISVSILSCKSDSSAKIKEQAAEDLQETGKDDVYMEEERYGLQDQYEDKDPDEITVVRNMHINLADSKIPPLREMGMQELKTAWDKSGKKSHIILDKDLYVYERIYDGKAMSDEVKYSRFWIDFDKDLTYKYGEGKAELGAGKYFYDLNKSTLLLLDNDTAMKPNKYEVKLSGEALVLVGNGEYHDNNWQAKLRKHTERPE